MPAEGAQQAMANLNNYEWQARGGGGCYVYVLGSGPRDARLAVAGRRPRAPGGNLNNYEWQARGRELVCVCWLG